MSYLASIRNGVFLSLLLAILAIGCSQENKPVIPAESVSLKARPPSTGPTKSEKVEVPYYLITVKRLLEGGLTIDEALEGRLLQVATLSYAPVLYGGRILTTQKLSEDFKQQYPDNDIQLIKIPVSYFPESPTETRNGAWNKLLKGSDVTIEFFANGDKNGTPIQIVDHFPNTTFSDIGVTFDAHIGVGANGKFTAKERASATFDAKIGYQFTYKPLKAAIISEGIANRARWKLREVKDSFPIGEKDYFVTVMIPRKLASAKAELTITLFLDGYKEQSFGPFPITVEFGESR